MSLSHAASLLIATLTLLLIWPSVSPAADLPDRTDPALQAALETTIGALGLAGATGAGKLAVALVDVTEGDQPLLAMINGHDMFYAASLPKIAILLGAAVQLESGRMVLDRSLDQDLHEMIRVSCNECASRVLDRIGREELLRILQSPEFRFYDADAGGGLWVGKPYGPEPAYLRDPVNKQSHGATVYQAARFYYLLHRRELVSPKQSDMMLSTLIRPGIEHKFVKGLRSYEYRDIYRKSGSWQSYHADSALVITENHAYIMVALAEDPDGSNWLENLAPRLHELVVKPNAVEQNAQSGIQGQDR